MFNVPCSKSVKKEKCKEQKEAAKPNTPPPCINIDDDNLGVTVEPWLSAGSSDSKGPKGSSNSRSSSDEEHGATLIVCPLSVLSNWTVSIIHEFTIKTLWSPSQISPPLILY